MKNPGRIIKVKYGYNPNSSSIGTHITALLHGSVIFALAANVMAAVIIAMKKKKKREEAFPPEGEKSR